MIADAADLSGGPVRLQPGTLDAALDRSRVEGMVGIEREEVVQHDEALLGVLLH